MDQLNQLYLRAQFLFLLQWFSIFGGLILVPSGHLLTSQNHYATSTKRSSMCFIANSRVGRVQKPNYTVCWWWVELLGK